MNTVARSLRRFSAMGVILLFLICSGTALGSASGPPTSEVFIRPGFIPASADIFPIYTSVGSLDPDRQYSIKARIKQSGTYFGQMWDPTTKTWLNQTDSWSQFPVVSSDLTGRLALWSMLKSTSKLTSTQEATLELVLRPFGSTSNLPAVSASPSSVYAPEGLEGGYVRGTSYRTDGSPAADDVVVGKNASNDVVCTGATFPASGLEVPVSTDVWFEGQFQLPCPDSVTRLELLDKNSLEVVAANEDIKDISGNFRSDLLLGLTESEVSDPVTNIISPLFVPLNSNGSTLIRGYARTSASDGTYISTVEYFIGDDPGLGSGASVPALDGSFDGSSEEFEFSINSDQLARGPVLVSVRSLDSNGKWSIPGVIELHVYDHVFSDTKRHSTFYASLIDGTCAYTSETGVSKDDECRFMSVGNRGYLVSADNGSWRFNGFFYEDDMIFVGRSWYRDVSGHELIVDEGVEAFTPVADGHLTVQ